MKRIITMTTRRTGSNSFVSLLNSHPSIYSLGEVFRPQYNLEKFIPHTYPEFSEPETRYKQWHAYLEAISAGAEAGVKYLAVKYMFRQSWSLTRALAKNANNTIITIRRENVLAQFSSELIAKKTGQGAVGSAKKIKKAKVHFNPKKFETFRRVQDEQYDKLFKFLETNDIPYLGLSYHTLHSEAELKRVCDHLEIPYTTLSTTQKKRNTNDIADRFKNPADVTEYCVANNCEAFLYEEVS